MLMEGSRQSKLSPSQLEDLSRSTHFDKKELQQWYKGRLPPDARQGWVDT